MEKDVQMEEGLWRKYSRETEKWFKSELEEMSFKDIISRYSGSKRKLYEKARDELYQYGLQSKHADVRMFVKAERFEWCDMEVKPPRAIQYRGPHYNLCLAKYVIPFEEAYYPSLHYGGVTKTRVIMKGLNNRSRAKLFYEKAQAFVRPKFCMIDHSAFDSTITVEHLKSTHRKYATAFGRKCRRLFRAQLKTTGRTKNGIKYVVTGTRMSGDADTGLGNTIVNLDAIYGVLRESGITKYDIIVDGDDAVIIIEEEDDIQVAAFRKMGFQTKFGTTTNIHHVDFCQCRLILQPEPLFVRKPIRVISNSTTALKRFPRFEGWIAAYGECEKSVVPGVPVLQAYCAMLEAVSDKRYYDQDLIRRMPVEGRTQITDVARMTFWEAFGVAPPLQEMMEEEFTAKGKARLGLLQACYPANCAIKDDELLSRQRAWSQHGNEYGSSRWWCGC